MDWFTVCGVRVSAINLGLACQVFDQWIKARKKAYVCVAPVSTIVECRSREDYVKIVNSANMVTPDGMPLVWLGKLKGHSHVERTYGADLMLAVFERGISDGYRHYFYGGTAQVCELLEKNLKKQFPGLNITGKYSPPFRELTKEEDEQIIDGINKSKPDILWVGLGSPKQDFWMANHRERLDVSVIVAVGAAFDFLSGAKKQAPRWMQRAGLEWFFRLCCEPKRLWKRYLVGNLQFIYFLIRDEIIKKR